MEPEVVAEHEHDARAECEVVSHHGREHVPRAQAGRGRQEPDGDDGRVLHQAEGVVQQVFVPGPLLFSIEEHEDVDDA